MRGTVIMSRHKSVSDAPNPFVHELKLNFLDKLQVAIMSVTVAPIRLILVVLFLLMVWPLAALAVAFRSEEDKLKPVTGWRLLLRPVVLFLCRTVFFAGGFYWVTMKGKQASSKEAPILLVAPHSSFFDALPVVFLGLTSVVAKASTHQIMLFGTLIEFSQPVLVKREDPNSRINTIKEIQRRGQAYGQWPQIIIFPEGTCTNRSCLISFKQGAFYPGVPVQPVCVRYPNRLDTITWTWNGPGAFTQLWLTLCQFYTRCEIEYLPVYSPSEAEKADPKLFANNVRNIMARCLQCPIADHTYDDLRPAKISAKSVLAKLKELESLHSKLGLSVDHMQDLLQRLGVVTDSRRGADKAAEVTFEEFSNCLALPKSDVLQQVFDLYDTNASGMIDLREYTIGLSLVTASTNNDSAIQLAFQLYDTDNKGYITQEELCALLTRTFSLAHGDAEQVFTDIGSVAVGRLTVDTFKSYAQRHPELSKIYTTYQEQKLREQHKSIDKDKFSNGHAAELEQWSNQGDKSSKKLQ
ncbi:hypothetical protein BsWGS_16495 [Bradybaena similaris]